MSPHGDHRLDGDAQTVLDLLALTATTVVGYLRILVHLTADAMSHELTYYSVALSLAVRLNGIADVADGWPATACSMPL